MKDLDIIFELSKIHCKSANIAEATLSSRVFGGGKKMEQIRAGKDIGVRRIARAIMWFSDNWIEGTAWPSDIERPLPSNEQVSPRFTQAGDVAEGGAVTTPSATNFNAANLNAELAEVG